MSADIKSLSIPSMLLSRIGIYGSSQVEVPFIYVVKEIYSRTDPYRCLIYPNDPNGQYEYCDDWQLKCLSHEVGMLFDAYGLDINTINFYNCTYPSASFERFTYPEEIKFKKNIKKVGRWHKNRLLHYRYPNVEDMLED